MRVDLISNGSATGSAEFWPGGDGTYTVTGTFGGSTITLQYLGPDDTTWVDAGADAILTAEGGCNFTLPSGSIRAEVVGGTPSAIYAVAIGSAHRSS